MHHEIRPSLNLTISQRHFLTICQKCHSLSDSTIDKVPIYPAFFFFFLKDREQMTNTTKPKPQTGCIAHILKKIKLPSQTYLEPDIWIRLYLCCFLFNAAQVTPSSGQANVWPGPHSSPSPGPNPPHHYQASLPGSPSPHPPADRLTALGPPDGWEVGVPREGRHSVLA